MGLEGEGGGVKGGGGAENNQALQIMNILFFGLSHLIEEVFHEAEPASVGVWPQ